MNPFPSLSFSFPSHPSRLISVTTCQSPQTRLPKNRARKWRPLVRPTNTSPHPLSLPCSPILLPNPILSPNTANATTMVATRLRLLDLHLFFRSDHSRKKRCKPSDPCAPTLGILAYEAARTISHLISIHNSLSPTQIHALRNVVFKSRGIQYLNSSDESFLLNLAFAEKIAELDRAAASISRLAFRCQRQDLQHFDRTYADLKTGNVDLAKLAFSAKEMPREIAKMEKLAVATAELYSAMGELTDLEAMDRKLQQQVKMLATANKEAEVEMVEQKLAWHLDHVNRLREAYLWSQPFDAVALPMARFVCNIFARICVVFVSYVSNLPQVICDENMVYVSPKQLRILNPFRSGPLQRTA